MPSNPWGSRGWTPDRIGDLTQKIYVITGANSGIGFEASLILAAAGARLLWLCRNPAKAEVALEKLRAKHPDADVLFIPCDLSNLASVREAADRVRSETDRVDAVINNAGIMMVPQRETTADGFEMQLGVNHMGHFVLNGRIADLVEAAEGRFVAVSSGAHKPGRMDFDDLMWERSYGAVKAYCRSKLANMLYVLELNRRLVAAGWKARAYATHPGYSATNLQSTGPGPMWTLVMRVTNLVAQSAERGSWPLVLGAVDELAQPGEYYGPTGLGEGSGPVGLCVKANVANDTAAAKHLWDASVKLTGERWDALD